MASLPAPDRIDPVGEALHHLRMSGAFYCRSEFSAPFGLELPPFEDTLAFHVVTRGRGWVEVAGEAPRAIGAGDLALVPHGRGHRLVSEPGEPAEGLFDLEREEISERYEALRLGGGGEPTTMLCGAVTFADPAARELLRLLPAVVVVDSWSSPEAQWLQSTVRFIADEARELRPGGETIITRLCDVLVVQAIRAWLAERDAGEAGWLGALRDEQIGRALALVHCEPSRGWTVETLARECAMSRSAFAARFRELVGETPMQYVTRWRMRVAHTWLRESDAGLAELAERLGYSSEAAFSRAFRREFGVSPGSVRRGG